MDRATITIHLPTHRREAIKAYGGSSRQVDDVYDRRIGHYVEYLRRQGRERGFQVETDQRDVDTPFTIDERDHEQKKAAHEWLKQVPDLWEWIT